MPQALRAPLALVLAASLISACGGRDDPEGPDAPSDPNTVRKEIIVRPGGSVVSIKYLKWVKYVGPGHWEDFTPAEPWPRYSKVETIVKTLPNVVARPDGATEPSVVAAADSHVVALFAGGTGSDNGFATREAVLYDPETQSGTAVQMVDARASQSMTRLSGGRVLVAGGYGTVANVPHATAEIFTLANGSFAATGSMALGRAGHGASVLADGRVLVTGGLVLQGAGPATDLTDATEIYDPATGTFSDGPSLTTARAGHSQVTLDDGRVLVLGGAGRIAEIYTPSTQAFTPVEDMAERHGFGHVAVKLANGKVLVTGGDTTFNVQPTDVVELFDPATDQFTTVGQMTTPRMQHFAALQEDGTVLIGGGRGADGSDLDSVEVYDPAGNTFTPGASLPGPSSDQSAAYVTAPAPP